jgi:hypothetical protein
MNMKTSYESTKLINIEYDNASKNIALLILKIKTTLKNHKNDLKRIIKTGDL